MKQLEAGRELDALIAEKVMGWTLAGGRIVVPTALGIILDEPVWATGNGDTMLPRFSADIAAAWKVVEEMQKRGYTLNLFIHTDNEDQNLQHTHVATFQKDPGSKMVRPIPFRSRQVTSPLAICGAAMKAVEHGFSGA